MRSLAAPLFLLVSATLACGEDDIVASPPPEEEGNVGEVTPDAGDVPADSGVEVPDPIVPDAGQPPPPETRVLRFDGSSPLELYLGQSIDLRFILTTAAGAPVVNETIQLSLAGTGASLNASSMQSDASGAGTVRLAAGASAAQLTLTALAERAQSVVITVVVRENPRAGIILDLRSSARIPVTSAEALLYIGAPNVVPSCATLLAAATPPTATLASSFGALPAMRTFSGYASGSKVAILATGRSAIGATIARGCTEGPVLSGGTNTTITVTLVQNPSHLEGAYDALLSLELGTALPAPYDRTVGLVADLLSDPAGWAVYQTLSRSDTQLGTSFITWTAPGETVARLATFAEVRANPLVFNTWREGRRALDDILIAQLGQSYIDVKNAGADIARVVREFEVGAHFDIAATSDPARVDVVESWRALVFTWQLGCPAMDLGCARRAIDLTGANAALAPTEERYGAAVSHRPRTTPAPGETERFRLEPDAHAINIRYGAIILVALNEVVFPNLPSGLAGNSLGQVLSNLVRCADVGASLSASTGLPASLFTGLCGAGVTAAAAVVEAELVSLDSIDNPSLVGRTAPGLTGGGEMFLLDPDHDLRTELLNELTLYAQWTDPMNPMLSQDLTAPILGEGRRAASACIADAQCTGGTVCAAIPSYLKVRALEKDCRRPVGATLGGRSCTADTDCASGLCFDPGAGSRICYAACEGAGSCTTGTCVADAAAKDLDGVLLGLGEANIAACMP